MSYSAVFSFSNSLLSFYVVRSLTHLLVLTALIAHQFFIPSFIDVKLSVSVYSLCFVIFALDSLCLFFYKEKQKRFLDLLLLFVDALFLSVFILIMEPPFSVFFVFGLIIFQSSLLFLFQKPFQSFIFFLYLSILLPVALLWAGKFSFEERLSLVLFVNISLCCLFFLNWLVRVISHSVAKEKEVLSESSLIPSLSARPAGYIGLSLELCRKLKPGLNSLIKYFPENTKVDNRGNQVSQNLFSQGKGRKQLEQIYKFISDFIEYAEPETESLVVDFIDLKELLQKVLSRMEKHPQRPGSLIEKVELPESLKVKGSAVHLNKCFEHILLNSFEALKSQSKPKIHIKGQLTKHNLTIEFADNGHGIKPDDMKKLFDPLFSQRFGLRGLGLPYIQKIVQAHKALLDIKSSDKGTKVIITFPLDHDSYEGPGPVKKTKKKRVA